MIGAIVKNDIVTGLMVISEAQVEEMSAALECEIVDARPYGLTVGDLRTAAGWTRNAGGEQMVLPMLDAKAYDSYTLAVERAEAAEAQVDAAAEASADEALAILHGEVTE